MERSDLLEANGKIFTAQGKALNDGAADDVKILVVGNPANTNALIAMNNAPDIPRERFTAMTRLDQNRALAQLAQKAGVHARDITNMTIWGNHSTTMYPDIFNAKIDGKPAAEVVDDQDVAGERLHPHGRQAWCGDHRGARVLVGGLGGVGGRASRPRLDQRHARGRVGVDGRSVARHLRRRGGRSSPRSP